MLSVSDATVDEGRRATIRVTLSAPSPNFVRVSFSTRRANAISGSDFRSKSGRITIPKGATEATFDIATVDDSIDEPNQYFWVVLRNPSGAVIGDGLGRVNIVDNDPPPTVRFERFSQAISEGTNTDQDTTINIRVRLSQRTEQTLFYTVHTSANTATELEYRPFAKRVRVVPKGRFHDLPVDIVADNDLEGQQQFYVYMRNPRNAVLDLPSDDIEIEDRIRTKVQIQDDDQLGEVSPIAGDSSFLWIGTFEREFTQQEAEAIAANSKIVVLAKFHADFDIEKHHQAAALLRSLNPDLKIFPYFNAKHWFLLSDWGTQPEFNWIVRDSAGAAVWVDTDRSPAHYFDLRNEACRQWIIATTDSWLETGLYDGIAFDSAGPVGDAGEQTYWQDLLGSQQEVDLWNAGLRKVLERSGSNYPTALTLFNGIGPSPFRTEERDTFQLDYTDGALNESFALDLDGSVRESLLDDLQLMQDRSDRILLLKTNIRDNGDQERNERLARFAYGAFLLGWHPGSSFFKFAKDDFYTTSELEDFPDVRRKETGLPLAPWFVNEEQLYRRDFVNCIVLDNPDGFEKVTQVGGNQIIVPGLDAVFLSRP